MKFDVPDVIRSGYASVVLAEARALRPKVAAMGHPLPDEPEGLDDDALAFWYLDVMGA